MPRGKVIGADENGDEEPARAEAEGVARALLGEPSRCRTHNAGQGGRALGSTP